MRGRRSWTEGLQRFASPPPAYCKMTVFVIN
nr:MAG TPA: hypothetical protein [Caudoviricetes sp.]